MHFVVLSSSRGTTFQAVIDAIKAGTLHAECLGLVTDKPDRECIQKATVANLPVRIVEKNPSEDREAYALRIQETIATLTTQSGLPTDNCPLIAALGWMRILPQSFVEQYNVLNVHPALLPKYGGEGMYGMHVHEAVLASGDYESGITIHLMDSGVDTGKILLQKTCPVLPNDTPQALQARVQELEKEWYPRVLEMIEQGEMQLPKYAENPKFQNPNPQ